ncbi:uncharacterized protein LOC127010918 [Drosophila biarmipes]|uniref:uncharacterized protein LOC127010918 n=1 Tax=Drosophila biarmipes TaxID=125945 RepID=UPI0021CC8DA4|nr:uncharacterized protein LOC127010918 [Drosophila biarmipes]
MFPRVQTKVCRIVSDFCREVILQLAGDYLPPDFLAQEKITETVKGFKSTGFPQCLGAIERCHIKISPKLQDAEAFRNNVALFALVDFRYRFSYISIGRPGKSHDSHIYGFKRELIESDLRRENAKSVQGVWVPLLLVGDSASRFSRHVMKPYPSSMVATPEQRAFNYHLTRGDIKKLWFLFQKLEPIRSYYFC